MNKIIASNLELVCWGGDSVHFYKSELKALKKANRYRTRKVYDGSLKDFSSNDYLGLASQKQLHVEASKVLQNLPFNSSKASMLVNGYHQVHKDFEQKLCELNGFEDGIVLGSGFCANVALIESLARKGDVVFMDELYHASGVLATNLRDVDVVFFEHNNTQKLKELLKNTKAKRKIIAVEGIYSMDGDLVDKEVFEIADEFGAILVVDEAHSSGVVGKKLCGVFDLYNVDVKPNHIKMGTLGKAYGSFGAYILASKHIVEYLINRAKPVIYATSLSLYDTLLAHKSVEYIQKNLTHLKTEIQKRQQIVLEELSIKVDGLIVPIVIADNKKVMLIQQNVAQKGFSIGAIRQPTVQKAILRVIARLGEDEQSFKELCRVIDENRKTKNNS